MKLIKPSVEYIPQDDGLEGIYKQIERCGRVCYKSEDKITDSSAQGFVERMVKSNHTAMLEHGTVYLYLEVNPENAFKSFDYPLAGFTAFYNWSDVVGNIGARYRENPYSKVLSTNDANCRGTFITTNYRVIVENNWLDDLQFICEPTIWHRKRYTVKFTTDRGVSHELVRHRVFSFAQESQRYCNYSKDKFGNEITFINNPDGQQFTQTYWIMDAYEHAEKVYFRLLKEGYSPQQARSVLPNATKTEIVMTGFEDDWKHFFDLRLRGTTGKPHPDMLVVAQLAWNEFKDKLNLKL